jgi:hypothetical protein
MLRKTISTYLLLATTVAGTGTLTRFEMSSPVVQTAAVGRTLPTAPVAPVQNGAPSQAPLSTAQLTNARGQGIFGWLKKIWNKYKKTIIKVLWTIVKEIIDQVVTTVTSSYQEGISGEVSEVYNGTDATEVNYASQADYDANVVQSSSYNAGSYSYAYTDYSAGSYSSGGEY